MKWWDNRWNHNDIYRICTNARQLNDTTHIELAFDFEIRINFNEQQQYYDNNVAHDDDDDDSVERYQQ